MENDWIQLFAEGTQGDGGAPAQGAAPAEGTAPEQQAEESPARAHWQQVDRIYDGMVAQAEDLREVFPDFDLRREAQNRLFCSLLRAGADMESAYCGAHFRQLLPAAMAYAAEYTRAQLASSLAGGARPDENGLTGSGAVRMGTSVASMSRAEFAGLCRQVEQGKKITLG